MYTIFDGKETYTINDNQQITRNKMEWMKPSDSWRAVSLVKYNNFGHIAEYVPFDKWNEFLESNPRIKYKNGKPMYFLIDYDHGTNRIWGSGIEYISKKT